MESIYQIFIASSLRLTEHRRAISQAVNEVNNSQTAKECNIHFCEFIYEKRPDILQKMEKYDAQAPADRALRGSAVFFLIIEDVVRDLTQYEFELALHRFLRNHMPQYIFIFHKEGAALKNTSEGISYEQLAKDYNLNDYLYNSKVKIVTHKKIYDIPYNDIENGEDSLKAKAIFELNRLLKSDELPFPGALLNIQLDKKLFFGNDILRLNNCPNVYYPRSFDDRLEQALPTNKVVILTGNSLSGKTRAMMEALRRVNDGWIYVFNKSKKCSYDELQELNVEFKRISLYLKRENAPKLYIYFDDIGLFLKNNGTEDVIIALDELTSSILASNHKAVLLATSTDNDIKIPGIDNSMPDVELLHIGDMTKNDFRMATNYFKSCGISIDEATFKYKMMGALFVNLNSLKDCYTNYLHGTDLSRYLNDEEKELHCLVRSQLLKSIKAQSIWHYEKIGDLSLILEMTRFFIAQKYTINPASVVEAFNKSIEVLCLDGKMGVLKISDTKLEIQEYVYNYFIGYNGEIIKEGTKTVSVEKEQKCIIEILRFCFSHYVEEPLTFQISRISSRCSFDIKSEIVSWLYKMWSGFNNQEISISDESDLVLMLQEDRKRCESGDFPHVDNAKIIHHYSHIIDIYIYQCCDFNMALQAFNACKPHMHTDHLLCAVMRKANKQDERDIIRQHAEYSRFRNGSYVVRAEIEWTDNYLQALDIINRFRNDLQATRIAEQMLNPNDIPYGIIQRVGSLNTLIARVKTEDELESSLDILRNNFTIFIKDRAVLEKIRNNMLVVTPERLTLVDILSKINFYSLEKCLREVYGGDIDASLDLLNRLTQSVGDTISSGFTSETEIRLLISRVGSVLIKAAADTGCSFDDVYMTLFSALQIPHPTHENYVFIFRNSFTYTAMMQCHDCDIINAINLFENDLAKHLEDNANPIYINRYILNTLLKKCEKEDHSYLGRINQLFNQLEVQRDTFSYYNLLKGGKDSELSLADCLEIVHEMAASKIEHNVFTLTALMACKDVNLRMALSFITFPPGLLVNYQPIQFPDLIIKNEIKAVLSEYDEAWSQIFCKPCKTQTERNILSALLKYLEETKKRDFFESGKIYNSLVSNSDYLRSCDISITFIQEKIDRGLFKPDSYTICHLVEKVDNQHGNDRKFSLRKLNEFLSKHPELIDKVVVNKRLHIYRSHEEQLQQTFTESNGTVTEEYLTPIKYVESMQRLHIPIDRYTIRTLTSKKINGLSDKICDKLLKILTSQQKSYYPSNGQPYDYQDSEIIRERCREQIGKYPELLLTPVSVLSHNKNVTWDFKKNRININTALSRLNWTNENSAVTEFNNIIATYINNTKMKDEGFFSGVLGYYHSYFGPTCGHTPSSFTFGVIVKSISNINDYKLLIREFLNKKSIYPRLSLSPSMLARMSAVVRTIDVLAAETRAYINAGGQADENTADVYLHRIANYLINTDPDNAIPIISDVFRYIILGGDAKSMLYYGEREYLLMNIYEDSSKISANTLRTIIIRHKFITNPMTPKEIVKGIAEKYSQHIPTLINLLVNDRPVRNTFVPLLFKCIKPFSRPVLSASALDFLARRIPQYDIKAYNAFLRQLYTIDCRQIEAVAPGLIHCIHRLSGKIVTDKEKLNLVRKTEAQIFTYSELNRLHCGHLLIEKAPYEYVEWCRHSMQSEKVSSLIESQFKEDRQTMGDRIMYFINNLDDAFSCSLMTMRKHLQTAESIDTKTRKIIEIQQKEFVKKINKREVSFKNLQLQPLLWIRAGWTPSEDLVVAIIESYTNMMDENESLSDAISNIILGLTASMAIADFHKSEQVSVRYSTIGNINSGSKTACLVSIIRLAGVLYLPLLRLLKKQLDYGIKRTPKLIAGCKIVEYYYACFLKNNPASLSLLLRLPHRWSESHWIPSEYIVQAMIQNISAIVVMGQPDSLEAEAYLNQFVKVNNRAIKEGNKKRIRLAYSLLGYKGKNKYHAMITQDALSHSLPDKYLLLLYSFKNIKDFHFPITGKLFYELKNAEQKFIKSLLLGNVPYPPLTLPGIWYKTNYIPNAELVLSLITYYAKHREKQKYIDIKKIKKLLGYSIKMKYEKTRLYYNLLGQCSNKCQKHIDIDTKKMLTIFEPIDYESERNDNVSNSDIT